MCSPAFLTLCHLPACTVNKDGGCVCTCHETELLAVSTSFTFKGDAPPPVHSGPAEGEGSEEENGTRKPEPTTAEKSLAEEKAQVEEQLKEMTDKYKRALADTENLRQRSQKMVDDAKLYGIQGFCKDLLEVADILEKATQSVPKEQVSSDNPHLKNLYDGLVMTEVQIQKVFSKHGLVKLDPAGQKFDPYEHEALFHTPVEGKDPGTVALVTKVGYKLHGRTLRPALVGVAKAP